MIRFIDMLERSTIIAALERLATLLRDRETEGELCLETSLSFPVCESSRRPQSTCSR
jgi:hypothetical protein